jgi:uncharacterized membrane protein YgaE (UPF0421/DUF939 family)
MSSETVSLIVGALGFITAIVTLIFSRRKVDAEVKKLLAESATEEVDTKAKISDLLETMQNRNAELHKENIALEKENSEKSRSIEVLTDRLESRDVQLAAATKQLDLLRSLAEQAPVTETLKTQLDAMNTIVVNLQTASAETSKILLEREKAYAELFATNRDLASRKPSK